MFYHLTLKSENVKTGDIPVSTSSNYTCPNFCPLKNNGCYASFGNLSYHWLKVSNGKRGDNFREFIKQITNLPAAQLWRHNQAGDIGGFNNRISGKQLRQLTKANTGKKGFTYTHKPVEGKSYVAKQNRKHIKAANKRGFTINLSANNINHADKLIDLKIGPVVCILPENAPEVNYTPKGRKIITCPAQTRDNVTCKTCRLCQKVDRKFCVGFISHGNGRKRVNLLTSQV
mgnify:CR=1 FL=1